MLDGEDDGMILQCESGEAKEKSEFDIYNHHGILIGTKPFWTWNLYVFFSIHRWLISMLNVLFTFLFVFLNLFIPGVIQWKGTGRHIAMLIADMGRVGKMCKIE